MGLRIRTNVDQVMSDLTSAITGTLARALVLTNNELRDNAQTVANRETARIYGLPVRALAAYTTLKYAKPGDLEASITVRGKGFPLSVFAPRQTRAGVSVRIKNRRIVIPHTFLAMMASGHVGVFARGAYGGKGSRAIKQTGTFGRFVFGRGVRVKRPNKWGSSELPINELYGVGPADAFANPDVTQAMLDRVETQAFKVLQRNFAYARRS